ncbi:uncharacterized protein BXZ73DRAFT_111848 [Epithele typhae]|uniref:uncharacterized protein n=1 Tax=Epithele typhae TaxID=378194 RepID=UPI002008BCAE|nr:uncharacterized protein BXZ73DRAFT_111848 [Epithele typhae]KAH9896141.1 hypothetical protein BXZ73DRAFT_111848 [Epithele typhae]
MSSPFFLSSPSFRPGATSLRSTRTRPSPAATSCLGPGRTTNPVPNMSTALSTGDGATQREECPTGQFSWEGASTYCSYCSGFHSDDASATTDVGGANPSGLNSQGALRRRTAACPIGQRSCPVHGISANGQGHLRRSESIDVRTDLETCGGCVTDDSPLGARNADSGCDRSLHPPTAALAPSRQTLAPASPVSPTLHA